MYLTDVQGRAVSAPPAAAFREPPAASQKQNTPGHRALSGKAEGFAALCFLTFGESQKTHRAVPDSPTKTSQHIFIGILTKKKAAHLSKVPIFR